MAERIPDNVLDLFQKPVLANVATVMPDGTPQVTPVWVDFDGSHILVNTVKGRRKVLNMQERPQVGLDMVDTENQFHWLSVRGHVVEITEAGEEIYWSGQISISSARRGTSHLQNSA